MLKVISKYYQKLKIHPSSTEKKQFSHFKKLNSFCQKKEEARQFRHLLILNFSERGFKYRSKEGVIG